MDDPREWPVIVVHGLWVHGLVMTYLAHRIEGEGFAAHTWSYPTMRLTLAENAERLARHCGDNGWSRLHIVAHSMGGLLALRMLEAHPGIRCERLLLLGSPYTGSASAERLAQFPGGSLLLGRSIRQWLDEPRPLPRAGAVGIIAGTRGLGLGAMIGSELSRPHDGVVSVAETAVPGVSERITPHVGHTEMLVSDEVARQCCAFLREGRFDRSAA